MFKLCQKLIDDVTLRLKIERKYWIHFWKIGLSSILIDISSLACFAFDHSEGGLDNRIAHLFTMMLTMVAFQFIVETKLPNIPYLTTLDKFMSFSMIYIFIVAVVATSNSVLLRVDSHATNDDELIDFISATSLFGFFCIVNIAFLVKVIKDRKRELVKLKLNCNDYEELGYDDGEVADGEYYEILPETEYMYVADGVLDTIRKERWSDLFEKNKDKDKEKETEKEKDE